LKTRYRPPAFFPEQVLVRAGRQKTMPEQWTFSLPHDSGGHGRFDHSPTIRSARAGSDGNSRRHFQDGPGPEPGISGPCAVPKVGGNGLFTLHSAEGRMVFAPPRDQLAGKPHAEGSADGRPFDGGGFNVARISHIYRSRNGGFILGFSYTLRTPATEPGIN